MTVKNNFEILITRACLQRSAHSVGCKAEAPPLLSNFLASKTFDTYRGKRRNLVCINKKIFQGDIK
ncbi:hypothetical protein [Brachyspira catarrhinii]|uniref:hypothetical protein n=1 Tax=Brachyspira catarrhinii TaxID=2528966 RepID=UPI0010FB2B14|nr:hypothetical protein [Brachyspira catarrhinii]